MRFQRKVTRSLTMIAQHSYYSTEQIQKAARVRELVKLGLEKRKAKEEAKELNEASQLSHELAEYLKSKYPNCFNAKGKSVTVEEWNEIEAYLKGDKSRKGKEIFDNIILCLKPQIHDVITIGDHSFIENGLREVSIFYDEKGQHIGTVGSYDGPDEWYEFIEEMGLTTGKARYLYSDKSLRGGFIFAPNHGKWPLK